MHSIFSLLGFFSLCSVSFLLSPNDSLYPPIDRKAWMNASPSTKLLKLKPTQSTSNYPTQADYMRVLERFPALAERGWRANYLGESNLGFFGDPDSAEMGLRSMGNFIFVEALLASDTAYDSAVTGVSQEVLLARARACLAYMTRSHITGDIACGDGKRWGNHWQSAWWTAKMALGAKLIWDKLQPEEQERVHRVVDCEADRQLSRKAPGGMLRDTKSEENAWDTEVLAVAVALFPQDLHAADWRRKLIEFELNSLSAPQDISSDRMVDGKLLKDQVYTENIHSDFTIENHGAYHAGYMACPLHSLAWGYYALASNAEPVPESQFHHFKDVWEMLKLTFLERRFAYMEGKDWPRYAYGLSFIMPALVVLENRYNDSDARAIEAARFRSFEEEQSMNGDGTFFGSRFTGNIMMDRMLEYETDCYANLACSYLLHKLDPECIEASSPRELKNHLTAIKVSRESGLAFIHTPEMFASCAWRSLNGDIPMALFVPDGMDSAVEWGTSNLVGRISADGVVGSAAEVQREFIQSEHGFSTNGSAIYKKRDGSPGYTLRIAFSVDSKTKSALIDATFTADADIVVTSVEGLRLQIANDIFNGGTRKWSYEKGHVRLVFPTKGPYPPQETLVSHVINSRWVNLDNRLGIVNLSDECPVFVIRESNRRNGPWGSIHYDVLDSPGMDVSRREFRKGDVVLHSRFMLMASNSSGARNMSISFEKGNK